MSLEGGRFAIYHDALCCYSSGPFGLKCVPLASETPRGVVLAAITFCSSKVQGVDSVWDLGNGRIRHYNNTEFFFFIKRT